MTNIDATPQVVAQTAESQGLDRGEAAAAATSTKLSKKRKKQVAALLTLLVILGLLFVWYLLNRKPLTELPGLSVAKAPHYQSSIYGMSKPQGVAVTPSGDRIYVTEIAGDRVVRAYNRAGKPVGILKPPRSTGAEHTPVYVAINPKNEDVYVSDRLTGKIYVYDAKGKYLRTFAPKGNLGGGFAPLGLAFGPDGTLYVTDVRQVPAKSHRVVAFAPDGTLTHSIGAPGQLSFPNGIAVDSHGNLQVSDSNNGRLVVFNVAGKMLATISPGVGEGDLGLPRGVAIDDGGRLYVVDTSDHTVRTYDVSNADVPTPKFIASFGGEGQLDGTFQYPNGVATDTRSHIYVTDRENNRVQVWGY